MRLSIPIYDDKKSIIWILYADIGEYWLSDNIKDILIGETGYCYIIDKKGVNYFSSFTRLKFNNWFVFIQAPVEEFLNAIIVYG